MRRAGSTIAAFAWLVLASGCPVGVGDISCVKDDNCPTGMYCGANGICGEGIPPDRDAGGNFDDVVDVGEPRSDGGDEVTDVASAPDATEDVGDGAVDAGTDASDDVPDSGDAGAPDVGPDGGDAGPDAGIEFGPFESSVYQGAAGVCESDDVIVRSVSGFRARQAMSNDDVVVRGTVFVR